MATRAGEAEMLNDAQTLCNRVQSHDGLAWHNMACCEVR
jgi:hypothetical protein